MPNGKLIVICQSGGKFITTSDGSFSYTGGDAHAISVSNDTRLDEFKSEMADMWKHQPDSMTLKYFLPNNKRTLITISCDKDIQRMIDFHEDSTTVDVYVMTGENPISDISTIPCSGSSRTTLVEPCTPLDSQTLAESCTPLDSQTLAEPYTSLDIQTLAEPCTPLDIRSPAIADAVDSGQQTAIGEAVDSGQQKRTKLWENCITGLHQQFNSVRDFRDALRKYSVAHGFLYTFKNNDNQRVTAKCKTEGCAWRIHASRLSTTQLFRIKKINGTHTCGAGSGTSTANNYHASTKLLASIVKEKLRDSPNCRPKEIANAIRMDFGIELKYSQAWRGMENARKELQGSYKDAYNQLPWLCEKILETNPGSVASLITREDLSFHRFFVAFYASIYGFQNGCRPLLFLDTLTLKSKYQSELLTAATLDGNDDLFPVAFAVVDVVNDDNWNWFLVQLKSVFSTIQPITFVSNRQMGLSDSISSIFSNSYHGYCLHHLTEELKRDMKGPYTKEVLQVIVGHFYDAAYAATVDGFNKCVESIKNISPEAYNWVLESHPVHWANALFQGSRYNRITSDTAQSIYSWVTELPVLPVAQMIDSMRRKIMELIYTRRVDSNQWSTRLTPCFEDRLQKEILVASSIQVLFSPNSNQFEVRNDLGVSHVVSIDRGECSCREWQITGLPCLHAVAVLQRFDRDIYDYCSKYFMTETFRLIYSESINPVPTADRPVQKESSPVQVHPPPLRRLSGLPKKRRDRSKGMVKRPLHCSRCKGAGHNRATCHIPS